GIPDLMFVIDTNKEAIAIQEAHRLGIPVVAVIDSNCDPDVVNFPIPGNDDAARAISLYCELLADAVLDGITESQAALGVDLGALETPMEPALAATNGAAGEPAEAVAEEPAEEAAESAPEAAPAEEAPEPAAAELETAEEAAAAPAAEDAPAEVAEKS
ncbi:MAG: 30S ribosomal protein S2, partial [Caulobacterales bacterium]|nr:30S ribosomal protein S2 [Caulobacterales bacterium]